MRVHQGPSTAWSLLQGRSTTPLFAHTLAEHLQLYARIKGVHESDLKRVVNDKLREFDLQPFANKKAGTLSGGNKRKLSVAIATIGDPQIIFLDEPSTGVDPVARRFMWRVIARIATEQKLASIILTTHSMVRSCPWLLPDYPTPHPHFTPPRRLPLYTLHASTRLDITLTSIFRRRRCRPWLNASESWLVALCAAWGRSSI